jgi:hypothetical protein
MRPVLVLLLVSSIAHAEPAPTEPAPTRNWKLGVEWMTDFPLQIGGQVWAELPRRFRLSMSFGELPDPYLKTINSILVGAGVIGQPTADLLLEALDHAFTWRIHVGWRPFKRRGAYVEGGFGILSAASNLLLADVVQLATGFPVPRLGQIGLGYHIDTEVETLGVEVGWMWQPWRSLTLRVSLGFAAAVAAQVQIAPNFAARSQQLFVRFAEDYVAELIEHYLFIPTVGFAVGWRLF